MRNAYTGNKAVPTAANLNPPARANPPPAKVQLIVISNGPGSQIPSSIHNAVARGPTYLAIAPKPMRTSAGSRAESTRTSRPLNNDPLTACSRRAGIQNSAVAATKGQAVFPNVTATSLDCVDLRLHASSSPQTPTTWVLPLVRAPRMGLSHVHGSDGRTRQPTLEQPRPKRSIGCSFLAVLTRPCLTPHHPQCETSEVRDGPNRPFFSAAKQRVARDSASET